MKAHEAVKLWQRIFLSSTTDGGKKSDSRFTRVETAHSTQPTRSSVGPNLMHRTPSYSCQESNRTGCVFYPLAYSLTPTGYPALYITSLA